MGGRHLAGRVSRVFSRRRATSRRQFWVERLEERYMMTADPLLLTAPIGTSPVFNPLHAAPAEDLSGGGGASFSLANTFSLHSNPGATRVIFLDFDGHLTQNTAWNDDPNDPEDIPIPSIVTPPYSLDGNGNFTSQELQSIQNIWSRVAEDFLPFNIDVTTEDPGSAYIAANGIRVLIGGSTNDWFSPPRDPAGGVAYLFSFAAGADIGCFVFSEDAGGGEKFSAEAASHEAGHSLGLIHDGQIIPGEEEPVDYYGGHGAGPTGWAPIMGNSYSHEISQWSKSEYPNAANTPLTDPPTLLLQDDLDLIATHPAGFGYWTGEVSLSTSGYTRTPTDHANTQTGATPLDFTGSTFFGEGLIGTRTDVDFFSFELGVEEVTFTIDPADIGFNLDILARLHDSTGTVIATSNPLDDVNATFSINTIGGSLLLESGLYYISIDGTSKPFTGDPGYSDYGSLGYFSISGTRKSHLEELVGVDFDIAGGITPVNWTLYSGGTGPAVFSDLQDESGNTTDINLSITSTKPSITSATSIANPATVPLHPEVLDEIGGYIFDTGAIWTFTWSDLDPFETYEVYVFGHADQSVVNDITIDGNDAPINFTQTVSTNDVFVNDELGDSSTQLVEYTRLVRATATGEITIDVTNGLGAIAGLAGLAIRPGKAGSIHGQKQDFQTGSGLEGWTIFIDENDNGILDDSITPTPVTSTTPSNLVDYQTIKSEISFSGLRIVDDVTVSVNITHGFAADLEIYLISPSGTEVKLIDDLGGGGDNLLNTTFDDSATAAITSINSTMAPFTGSFRPMEPLSTFAGEDPSGLWTLRIKDDQAPDVGVLNSWTLTITGAEIFTVTDALGNYSFEDLPPREQAYNIREVQQEGWFAVATPAPVTVTPGARLTGRNFVNREGVLTRTIEGTKYNDMDADGERDPNEPGLEGWTIFLDGNNNGVFDASIQAEPPVVSTEEEAIVDFLEVRSTLDFSGGLTAIADIDVQLDISHSFNGDLDVYLISPSGTEIELFTGVGGQLDNFPNTIFDDEAAIAITAAPDPLDPIPYDGSFRPEELLNALDGENPNGVWTLVIQDTSAGDVGMLHGWSLTISTSEQFTTTLADDLNTPENESGYYKFDNLPVGDYRVFEVPQAPWVQTSLSSTGNIWWDVTIGPDAAAVPRDFGNHSDLFDDHANSAVGATVVTVPGGPSGSVEVEGRIELPGDVDWFSFNAVADTVYLFEVELGTLSNSVLRLIGPNGTTELELNDDAIGLESVIRWTAPVNGTYFAEVKAAGSQTGSYDLSISKPLDDHGDDATQATTIAAPTITAGNIETLFDPDWFEFTAVAGTEYKLQTILGTLQDSVLRIFGTDGITELAVHASAGASGSIINWIAPSAGLFFAEVQGVGGTGTGTYSMTMATDDHGDDAPNATSIAGPGTTAGILELSTDVDWFSFTATAGTSYLIEAKVGSLADPRLRLIDSNGTAQLIANDNFGADNSALIQWTATITGTYYLEVKGTGTNFGAYSVVLTLDDHASSAVGAAAVAVPSNTAGVLNVGGDEDWFSFSASIGTTYRIETTLGTLFDSVLNVVHTDQSTILATGDDTANGLNSLIIWTPPTSGTYYVRVLGYDPDFDLGTYQVSIVSANVLPGDYNRDNVVDSADYLLYRKTLGKTVAIGSGADGNLDGVIGPEDFEVWEINFRRVRDDHANTALGATVTTVPGFPIGNIETVADVDWFAFNAVVGTTYLLEVGLGTLVDSELRLIGPNGTTEVASNDDAIGLESVIRWTAPTTGTYYAEVKGSGAGTGTYDLSITVPVDDHGDDATEPTALTLPVIRAGNIETLFDTDWFSFTAAAATEYKIQTILGTLEDSVLRIIAANGVTVLVSDSSAGDAGSFLRWTPPAAGSFFIEVVSLVSTGTGTYQLSIAADDHGDDSTDATVITPPVTTPVTRAGIIELPSDVDWFSFNATAGTKYLIEATLGSLNDTRLRLVKPDGTTTELFNDNHGADLASLIQWTAPTTGTYYLEVTGTGTNAGGYNVVITLDDHSSSPAGATTVTLPANSAGVINVRGDEDWFKFNATIGTTYRIETTLATLPNSVLYVLHPDGVTVLDSDDDSGPGAASLLFWDAPATGDYYVRVIGFNPDLHTGTYSVQITAPAPGGGASAFGSQPLGEAAFGDYEFAGYGGAAAITEEVTTAESAASLTHTVSPFSTDAVSFQDVGFRAVPLAERSRPVRETVRSRDAALTAWLSALPDGDEQSILSEDDKLVDEALADSGSDYEWEELDAVFDLIGV